MTTDSHSKLATRLAENIDDWYAHYQWITIDLCLVVETDDILHLNHIIFNKCYVDDADSSLLLKIGIWRGFKV